MEPASRPKPRSLPYPLKKKKEEEKLNQSVRMTAFPVAGACEPDERAAGARRGPRHPVSPTEIPAPQPAAGCCSPRVPASPPAPSHPALPSATSCPYWVVFPQIQGLVASKIWHSRRGWENLTQGVGFMEQGWGLRAWAGSRGLCEPALLACCWVLSRAACCLHCCLHCCLQEAIRTRHGASQLRGCRAAPGRPSPVRQQSYNTAGSSEEIQGLKN